MIIFKILLFCIVILFSVAYLTFFERKVIAYMQKRVGPNTVGPFGLLQPIADGIKLLHKEIIIPKKASRYLFILAPIVLFAFSLSTFAVIPWFDVGFDISLLNTSWFHKWFDFKEISSNGILVFSNINIGILYVIAMSSIGVYGILISGFASNSIYAILGSLRSAAQMISYEVCIGFVMLCVLVQSKSLNLIDIVLCQKDCWTFFKQFPIWCVFFIASLAETNRLPFDLPEAEAELVSGYNVEYSSFPYALFYLSEYAAMILMSTLNVILFFGGWLPFKGLGFIPSPLNMLIKISFILFLFLWIRATLPRLRYDQLMKLCWQVLMPISFLWFVVISILKINGIAF